MDRRLPTRYLALVAALLILNVLELSCSSGREDPLLSAEELFTPTPLPSDTAVLPTPTGEPIDTFGFDYNGTVRIAQWNDPAIQMENFIVGFIIVQGMLYEAKIVELLDADYRTALESGEVDLVLEMSRTESSDWYQSVTESGTVLDVGSLFGDESEFRIGIRSELREMAPPVYDLLSKTEADEEVLSDLAARITGGRVGIKPNVAALIFFKDHEDVWTSWVRPDVVDNVKAAIGEGKTSLHHKCLRVPGDGNTLYCK